MQNVVEYLNCFSSIHNLELVIDASTINSYNKSFSAYTKEFNNVRNKVYDKLDNAAKQSIVNFYDMDDINLIKDLQLFELIDRIEKAIIVVKPIEPLAIHNSINRINQFHIRGHIDKNVNDFQNIIRDVERHIPKMISSQNKYERKHYIDSRALEDYTTRELSSQFVKITTITNVPIDHIESLGIDLSISNKKSKKSKSNVEESPEKSKSKMIEVEIDNEMMKLTTLKFEKQYTTGVFHYKLLQSEHEKVAQTIQSDSLITNSFPKSIQEYNSRVVFHKNKRQRTAEPVKPVVGYYRSISGQEVNNNNTNINKDDKNMMKITVNPLYKAKHNVDIVNVDTSDTPICTYCQDKGHNYKHYADACGKNPNSPSWNQFDDSSLPNSTMKEMKIWRQEQRRELSKNK